MKTGARTAWVVSLALWAGLPRAQAQAQGGEPAVVLQVDPCLGVPCAEVERLFFLELSTRPVEAANPDALSRAQAGCRNDGLVQLTVDDAVTGKSLLRVVDLSTAAPGARVRLVALALAELVLASWSELQLKPAPVVAPVQPQPPPEIREAMPPPTAPPAPLESPKPGPFRVVAVGGYTAPENKSLWAGGLRVGGDHGYHLGWLAGVEYEGGQTGTLLGSVSHELVTGVAWAALHASPVPELTLRGGVGVRGGLARMSGRPDDSAYYSGQSLSAAFVGPAAYLGVTIRISRLVLEPSVEGVWYLQAIEGRVGLGKPLSFGGPSVGVRLGLGVMP